MCDVCVRVSGMFKAMSGKPVTIRLLDPPLHEFLPQVPTHPPPPTHAPTHPPTHTATPPHSPGYTTTTSHTPHTPPKAHDDIQHLAQRLGRGAEEVEREIRALHEDNPMLGFRGCRLSIKHPEITCMQVWRGIVGACGGGWVVMDHQSADPTHASPLLSIPVRPSPIERRTALPLYPSTPHPPPPP
jgi:hypothetical protein